MEAEAIGFADDHKFKVGDTVFITHGHRRHGVGDTYEITKVGRKWIYYARPGQKFVHREQKFYAKRDRCLLSGVRYTYVTAGCSEVVYPAESVYHARAQRGVAWGGLRHFLKENQRMPEHLSRDEVMAILKRFNGDN